MIFAQQQWVGSGPSSCQIEICRWGGTRACEPRFADAISDRATLRLPSWRERPKPMSFRLRRAPYKPIEQKHWRMRGCGAEFRAHLVNYADDFVILSRGC